MAFVCLYLFISLFRDLMLPSLSLSLCVSVFQEQEFMQKQQQDLDSALKKIIQQHKHELATIERDCLNHKQQLLRGTRKLLLPLLLLLLL